MLPNIHDRLSPAKVDLHVLLALATVRKSVYHRIARNAVYNIFYTSDEFNCGKMIVTHNRAPHFVVYYTAMQHDCKHLYIYTNVFAICLGQTLLSLTD
jgi:hypothetical protein